MVADSRSRFNLVVIDARGTVSVTRHGIEQICSGPAKANRLRMLPPPRDLVGRLRQVGEDPDRGGGSDDALTQPRVFLRVFLGVFLRAFFRRVFALPEP